MTWGIAAVAIFLALFVAFRFYWFFRDPDRTPPPGTDVLSPADGFVVYVHAVVGGEVPIAIKHRQGIRLDELTGLAASGEPGLLVGIFMTSLDVHVNRAPIDGVVTRSVRSRGAKNLAMARMFVNVLIGRRPYEAHCEHLLSNERHTIVIDGHAGLRLSVTQIADIWANQVICNVGEGDRVERGGRFGMIRMGSQVDVYIPDARRVREVCEVGAHVTAGQTVLARLV